MFVCLLRRCAALVIPPDMVYGHLAVRQVDGALREQAA